MFLMVCTRHDVAYAISCLSKYMSNAGLSHLEASKWLLRDSSKSTTFNIFTLRSSCISWKSQLQHTVALSTTEAEYTATTEAFKEAIWLEVPPKHFGYDDRQDLTLGLVPFYGSWSKMENVEICGL
ncbi:Secreted RxLR effector protein [Sesamum angolense]|uniref:Secreted RxLR effector protein n=1 Tax=Sesamum angolense TaxID=2727404 RepID=A0AAE1T8R0_9LAMI|nr:Secreted RxLR effector protein [Sesamum angolense]